MYYNGGLAATVQSTMAVNFSSATQGTMLTVGVFGPINNPPLKLSDSGSFASNAWYATYCAGELTVTLNNPPVPGPITQTYIYALSESGKVLTLTPIGGLIRAG